MAVGSPGMIISCRAWRLFLWDRGILVSRQCIQALHPFSPGEEGAFSGIPLLDNEAWTPWAGWPSVGWLVVSALALLEALFVGFPGAGRNEDGLLIRRA